MYRDFRIREAVKSCFLQGVDAEHAMPADAPTPNRAVLLECKKEFDPAATFLTPDNPGTSLRSFQLLTGLPAPDKHRSAVTDGTHASPAQDSCMIAVTARMNGYGQIILA